MPNYFERCSNASTFSKFMSLQWKFMLNAIIFKIQHHINLCSKKPFHFLSTHFPIPDISQVLMYSVVLNPGVVDGQPSVVQTQSLSTFEAVLSVLCKQMKLPLYLKHVYTIPKQLWLHQFLKNTRKKNSKKLYPKTLCRAHIATLWQQHFCALTQLTHQFSEIYNHKLSMVFKDRLYNLPP